MPESTKAKSNAQLGAMIRRVGHQTLLGQPAPLRIETDLPSGYIELWFGDDNAADVDVWAKTLDAKPEMGAPLHGAYRPFQVYEAAVTWRGWDVRLCSYITIAEDRNA